MTEPVQYRAATRDDLRFILSAWVSSFSARRKPPEGLSPKRHREAIRNTIADILRRPTCAAVIACNPLNPTLVWGFAVFETGPTPILHYCYVKEVFRGNDIGSQLVAHARGGRPGVMRYSFRTPACRKFLPEAQYDKRLLRTNREVA